VKISTIAGKELTSSLADRWAAWHQADAALSSPYFHPEFTRCVARLKPNVEIAVLEEENRVVGFFPYERVSSSLGRPVGGVLSDFHGLVCDAGVKIDPLDLLRACKLAAWDFSHLPISQPFFSKQRRSLVPSPQIDLARGYALFLGKKKASGSGLVDRATYLERRLDRDIGPIRYVALERNPGIFDQAIAWKSAQYLKSGLPDLFRAPWTRALLQSIRDTQTEGFSGILSALYAGDRLIACHFGMRSQGVWHYWFPSYDPAFSKYSPGLLLILRMAESAPRLGLNMIDLGAGASPLKDRLATGCVILSAGSIELPSWLAARRTVERRLAAWMRNSPLEGPARALFRKWRAPPDE
jgi:CelD/BcsL family acetyltransferase involved in cellulose biosynthesis